MTSNIIVIFGRPNVGKSTLFNKLTKSRSAVIDPTPGVTRDRHYGNLEINATNYILVDTGGFTHSEVDPLQYLLNQQVELALQEADLILWLVDAKTGYLPEEQEIANKLRVHDKPVIVCANKAESLTPQTALADFYTLGFNNTCAISSAHNQGINHLTDLIYQTIPPQLDTTPETNINNIINLAIIGRPNVGKSTLVNTLLKNDRMLVSDISGTTRDSISSDLKYKGKNYKIIDTAGIRKKSKISKHNPESYSVIRSLKSIEQAEVIIVMCDANEGVTDQDCQLINYVIESGRGLLIVFNKQDCINDDNSYQLEHSIDKRLNFINFTKPMFCTAKYNKGLAKIMRQVNEIYNNTQKTFTTSALTNWLNKAQLEHEPPMINSRRIKLRFAHMSKGYPPYIVIHGKQITKLPNHYKRYLENSFRNYFNLTGIPIRLSFNQDHNPYVDS